MSKNKAEQQKLRTQNNRLFRNTFKISSNNKRWKKKARYLGNALAL